MEQAKTVDRHQFLERMAQAPKAHTVISEKRAIKLVTKTTEGKEEETLAPLPVGTRVWHWPQFSELFFLIPDREPFRVADVKEYSICKMADLGLRQLGKRGPIVRVTHKDKASEQTTTTSDKE